MNSGFGAVLLPMNSIKAWKQFATRMISMPWLIIATTILTVHGWLSDENAIIYGWSAFYLQLLTLPLALALMTGFFPDSAPFNPDDSRDFWKVSSISFKLFLVVTAFVFLLFRLNRG